MPPASSVGAGVAPHGPSRMPRYHPQDATQGRATWSVGHYGEVFEAKASEAYVPCKVDREYALEDDPSSFLEQGWEEEALQAETF